MEARDRKKIDIMQVLGSASGMLAGPVSTEAASLLLERGAQVAAPRGSQLSWGESFPQVHVHRTRERGLIWEEGLCGRGRVKMRPRWLSVARSPPAAVPAGRGGHTHGHVRTAAGPAVVQLPARERQELEEAGRSLRQSPPKERDARHLQTEETDFCHFKPPSVGQQYTPVGPCLCPPSVARSLLTAPVPGDESVFLAALRPRWGWQWGGVQWGRCAVSVC